GKDFSFDSIAVGFDLFLPSVHHLIHRLDLHFGDALHLRTNGIDDLLRPSQRSSSRSHLLDDLLAVFLTVFGGLDAPGGHRVKGGVHRPARFFRKRGSPHRIEIARGHLGILVLHGRVLLSLIVRTHSESLVDEGIPAFCLRYHSGCSITWRRNADSERVGIAVCRKSRDLGLVAAARRPQPVRPPRFTRSSRRHGPNACDFVERNVMEYPLDHSGLMFAERITLAHFSVSAAMNLPKSAGEPGSTMPPRSASRILILGSARPALISRLSLSMISAGVLLGVPSPSQALDSYPGTKSPMVGISGNASERIVVVTARAWSLPALTYWIDEGMVGNMTC